MNQLIPIYIVVAFCLMGCRSTKEKEKAKLCGERIEFIRNHIFSNDSTGVRIFYFKGNPYPEVQLILDNSFLASSCFEGWHKKDVHELMGKPTEDFTQTENKNYWWYFLINADCGQVDKECTVWEFYFDKKDRVSRFVEKTLYKKPDWIE